MAKSYQVKIKKCGTKYCVYEYSNPIVYDFEFNSRKDYSKSKDGLKEEKNIIRTRQTLCDIVACNANIHSKFLTLTFKDITLDKDIALKAFNYFTHEMKRKYNIRLSYIMIRERQKKRGLKEGNLGSWHFHMILFNDSYIPFARLKDVWGKFGSLDIKAVKEYYQLERYIGKYIQKDFVEGMKNERLIYTSQGLKRPDIFKLKEAIDFPQEKKTYSSQYVLPLEASPNGIPIHCNYTEYQLALDTSSSIINQDKET